MSKQQLGLFEDPEPAGPPGFVYRPDVVTAAEEQRLLDELAALPFEPFQFRGYEGRRRVHSFGWKYDFTGPGLVRGEAMPAWLHPVRDRAADIAGLPPDAFEHVLINEYREGAPIGWHKDRPVFDKVVGVSLGAPTTMRFRKRVGEKFTRINVPLAPRSAYLIDGPARAEWEHSLPEAQGLRYSITFRDLRS